MKPDRAHVGPGGFRQRPLSLHGRRTAKPPGRRHTLAGPTPPCPAGGDSVPDYRFPRKYRLRKSPEFQRVFEAKQRVGDADLLVFAVRSGLPYTRLGLSVSRKHGSAVRRNRLKRLIREAFRLSRHELPPGLDLVVIPRIGRDHSLESIRRSLIRLARRLNRRLPPHDQPGRCSGDATHRSRTDGAPDTANT